MKKKFRMKIGELFSFFNLDDDNYEKINYIERDLFIKDPTENMVKINALIKKTGNIFEYTLEDGIKIRCDENHLIKNEKLEIVPIKDVKLIQCTNGIRKIISSTFIKNDDVYDMSLNYPHLYATSTGIICHNTTLAKIIINNIECDNLYINASDKGGVDFVREQIIPFVATVGFKKSKIVVLDECDYMSPNAQAALRNCMEVYSTSSRFILTANYKERIMEPVTSRCQQYEIFPPSKKEIALRMIDILKQENVEYNNDDLAQIINVHYPDMRAIINSLNKNTIDKKLTLSKEVGLLKNFKIKLLEYLKMNDTKESFKSIRQLLLDEGIRDYSYIFKFLYDEIDNYAKGHIADTVLIIAEYHYKDAFMCDKEINFCACLIEILKTIHS